MSKKTAEKNQQRSSQYIWTTLVLLGILFRFLVAMRGHNSDLVSWMALAKVKGNIYAQTVNYNYQSWVLSYEYGPIWHKLLRFIDHCSSVSPQYYRIIFRLFLIGILSIADFGIFIILFNRYAPAAAYLFFLNPISIIITGYSNGFENLALLFGMLSALMLEDKTLTKRKLLGLIVLGFSLMIKHLLFIFPLWMAVKQHNLKDKLFVLLIPIIVFLFGFLPYYPAGKDGIYYVFQYSSSNNKILYSLFAPSILKYYLTNKQFWFLILVAFSFVYKKKTPLDSLLFYTGVLLIFSPAMSIQYLSVVMPFVCIYYRNIFFVSFATFGTWYLLINSDGLHFLPLSIQKSPDDYRNSYFAVLLILLFIGQVWESSRPLLLNNPLAGIKDKFKRIN